MKDRIIFTIDGWDLIFMDDFETGYFYGPHERPWRESVGQLLKRDYLDVPVEFKEAVKTYLRIIQ